MYVNVPPCAVSRYVAIAFEHALPPERCITSESQKGCSTQIVRGQAADVAQDVLSLGIGWKML